MNLPRFKQGCGTTSPIPTRGKRCCRKDFGYSGGWKEKQKQGRFQAPLRWDACKVSGHRTVSLKKNTMKLPVIQMKIEGRTFMNLQRGGTAQLVKVCQHLICYICRKLELP